jgi:hypothetical protein
MRREHGARRPPGQTWTFTPASVTSGTFGNITDVAGGGALANASYIERTMRLGIRFSF